MAAAAEIQLVYVFSAMLTFGAVLLAFVPVLSHAATFAASRRTFGMIVALILFVGLGAILVVNVAVSNPLYFVPIAAITVGLRLSSPFLLYRRIQDRFEATKGWIIFRWLVVALFLGFAALLVYHLVLLAGGSEAADLAVLSEQLAMAFGASMLIVRGGLRIRPKETAEAWPIWAAAILLALAFVVVLPYAIPAFEVVYAVTGLIGWTIGIVAIIFDF